MAKSKIVETLTQTAIRLHRDVYDWAVQKHQETPDMTVIELQDAIYKELGKKHLSHSFQIFLIAEEAMKK